MSLEQLMTPLRMTADEIEAFVGQDPGRVIRVLGYGEPEFGGIPGFTHIAAPALAPSGECRRSFEVMALPADGQVTRSRLARSGEWIETSRWDGGALLRVAFPRASPRDAAYASYVLLLRVQRETGLVPVRFVNYIPKLTRDYREFNVGRHDAWLAAGPKLLEGDSEQTFTDFIGKRWRPVSPAATDVGVEGDAAIVEGWFAAPDALRIQHVRSRWQHPWDDYQEPHGRLPIRAHGTYLEAPSGQVGMVIAVTASMVGASILHDRGGPEFEGLPAGDADARCLAEQITSICDNLEALLSETSLDPQGVKRRFELSDLTVLRVYLRDPSQVDMARDLFAARLSSTPLLFVEASGWEPGMLVLVDGLAVKPEREFDPDAALAGLAVG